MTIIIGGHSPPYEADVKRREDVGPDCYGPHCYYNANDPLRNWTLEDIMGAIKEGIEAQPGGQMGKSGSKLADRIIKTIDDAITATEVIEKIKEMLEDKNDNSSIVELEIDLGKSNDVRSCK